VLRTLVTALATAAAALTLTMSGCDTDDAGCTSDYDCEAQQVCEVATGKCAAYNCQSCKIDEVCEDNRCVAK